MLWIWIIVWAIVLDRYLKPDDYSQYKRDQPWDQAPQRQAHFKAEIILTWFTKFCFKINVLERVWPPHDIVVFT